DWIRPRSLITTMASGMLLRIDSRCAVRASTSWVLVRARRWKRNRIAPRQDTARPTSVNTSALTASVVPSGRTSETKNRPNARPSTVASSAGPQPPSAEAIRTAGMYSRYDASPRNVDANASLTASPAARARTATAYGQIILHREASGDVAVAV